MANSRTPAELKNCKVEKPSLLFRPLVQYLGSDKRRVLAPCVTFLSFPIKISTDQTESSSSKSSSSTCRLCYVALHLGRQPIEVAPEGSGNNRLYHDASPQQSADYAESDEGASVQHGVLA